MKKIITDIQTTLIPVVYVIITRWTLQN